jgi:hypothetical protein
MKDVHRTLRVKPTLLLAAALCAGPGAARADVATDWNRHACEFIAASRMTTQAASRVMAIAHTAAFEAANAIAPRHAPPGGPRLEAPSGASVEAAIAAAHRSALAALLPAQQAAIDAAYRAALAAIVEGPAKDAGVAVGERAAREVLARRADDGAAAPEAYRPLTTAGRYVPTTIPATTQWPQRKPWLLSSPAQFRPGPPPTLDSERWARDYNGPTCLVCGVGAPQLRGAFRLDGEQLRGQPEPPGSTTRNQVQELRGKVASIPCSRSDSSKSRFRRGQTNPLHCLTSSVRHMRSELEGCR